jgi:hypothetical protein
VEPAEQLQRLLLQSDVLSKKNKERCARVFYDATKIVLVRQDKLHKKELKPKEISAAMVLADMLNSQPFQFNATGELAENFGGDFFEDQAWDYFDKKVLGSVSDVYGRKITIGNDFIRSLYKDPKTGDHEMKSEYYEQVRGKRLPWVRYTLKTSSAIYMEEATISGAFRRTLSYTAIVTIPLKDAKPDVSYYVIPVREDKNKNLHAITAYSMGKRNRLLAIIALCKPYTYLKEK